jgi:type III pantothenate kinase
MMSHDPHSSDSSPSAGSTSGSAGEPLLAIAVGNTRLSAALFPSDSDVASPGSTQSAALGSRLVVDAAAADDSEGWVALTELFNRAGSVCIASVHSTHAERVRTLAATTGTPLDRIGADIPIPLRHTLDDAKTLGQDRALNALAAFSLVGEAVAIVDAGTAVTIDFVDGTGVFQGGLILPGLGAMLDALHASTHALPRLTMTDPADRPTPGQPGDRGPYGKDTAHAMRLGVATAVNGAIRLGVEQFALAYEAYPRVIGTGGDAWLFDDEDSIVERTLPELQLIGIHRAWLAAVNPELDTGLSGAGDA